MALYRESENIKCASWQGAQKGVGGPNVKCVGSSGTGEWGRLHNTELYELYCLANIIRVIK